MKAGGDGNLGLIVRIDELPPLFSRLDESSYLLLAAVQSDLPHETLEFREGDLEVSIGIHAPKKSLARRLRPSCTDFGAKMEQF